MDMDMSLMAIAMVVGTLIVVAGLVAAVYVVARAIRSPATPHEVESGRTLLDRRLATGEIDADDYYEREAALRSAQPVAKRRHRRP